MDYLVDFTIDIPEGTPRPTSTAEPTQKPTESARWHRKATYFASGDRCPRTGVSGPPASIERP